MSRAELVDPRTLRQASRRLRSHTPTWADRGARGAVELAGRATAGVRMLPDFVVVGAQRCGTTTLYRLLSEHPQVVRPLMHKGVGYFDLNYDRGRHWYRGHFPLQLTAARRSQASGAAVTFESSGYYLYHPLAAGRLAGDLPGVRTVAMVRDPVDRAYSAHSHELARGFETEPFEAALELEAERLKGEEERLRADPGYQSLSHRHHSYLRRGRYAYQLRRLAGAVGRDRVYVLDADDFFADPLTHYLQLLEWLGLSAHVPARVEKANARSRPPMNASLRRRLLDELEADDRDLQDFLGHEPSWRR